MKVNTEIELKDLIQIIIIIVGGIFTYCLVNSVITKNDTIRTKQLLLKELPALIPNLKIHYTNQFSKEKDTLFLKVYMKNFGQNPLFVPSPNLYLLFQTDTIWGYEAPDLFSTYGSLDYQQERRINYTIYGYPEIPDSIRLSYPTFSGNKKLVELLYSEVLSESFKSIKEKDIEWLTNKEYKYYEETYQQGDNDIWKDFFDNPR